MPTMPGTRKNQRPELWRVYQHAASNKGESIRVFPLSNWTELDIWHICSWPRTSDRAALFRQEAAVWSSATAADHGR